VVRELSRKAIWSLLCELLRDEIVGFRNGRDRALRLHHEVGEARPDERPDAEGAVWELG
jgi:hypothetical protein